MGHKEDLLVGAKRALFEKGYARTTARDIVALSGTNLGSIGYHYGSTDALMTAAMISAMEEWGDAVGLALAGPPVAGEDPMVGFWRRVIDRHRHRTFLDRDAPAGVNTKRLLELVRNVRATSASCQKRPAVLVSS